MMASKDDGDPRFGWVRAHPLLGKIVIWSLIAGFFIGVGLLVWYKLSQGRVASVLGTAIVAIFIGWKFYRDAKATVRS